MTTVSRIQMDAKLNRGKDVSDFDEGENMRQEH